MINYDGRQNHNSNIPQPGKMMFKMKKVQFKMKSIKLHLALKNKIKFQCWNKSDRKLKKALEISVN